MEYIRKNGLLYTPDKKTIVAVDSDSNEFTGRVPFGAHYIEDEVFADSPCESISLPDSVEQVGACLFQNSKFLEKVKLPSGMRTLSPYLFAGCSSLVKVSMPTVIDEFPEGLFYQCTSLTEIPFRAGIKELPENVFAGCSSIQSLVIPSTVEKIGSMAVANCTALTTVVLPASLFELADDAFEGCNSISKVRIAESNNLFYVSEKDGCLYERTADGDKLKIKVTAEVVENVNFYKENVDDETDAFYSDESIFEEDDTFSSEIGADENEIAAVEQGIIKDSEIEENKVEQNLDDVLADIMNDEKARNVGQENVAVGEKESQVLTEMMDCMNDKPAPANDVKISEDELARLFESHESAAVAAESAEDKKSDDEIDNKTQILLDSVKLSKVIECEPKGECQGDPELFIIAEQIESGFSTKLENCAKRIAEIQDFKRIYMLGGLPVENEEFMQFFYHFMSMRNVVLACTSPSPSKLSDYSKKICENARIDLEKEALVKQRKRIGIKNSNLIKLVIQDLAD
jgi:hypothetical protein